MGAARLVFRNGSVFDGRDHRPRHALVTAGARVLAVVPETRAREYDGDVVDLAGMDDPAPTYLRAAESGRLTARVRGALWWDRDLDDEQIPDLQVVHPVDRPRFANLDVSANMQPLSQN